MTDKQQTIAVLSLVVAVFACIAAWYIDSVEILKHKSGLVLIRPGAVSVQV